jgi:type IV pilus assembly protein PilC
MAKFNVTAVGKDGDTYHEVIEAPDRFAVYRDVRARGDRVIDLAEDSLFRGLSLSFITDSLHSISLDEKVVLSRNLAAMLEAGLTISRALGVMERQTKNPRLKSVIGSIIGDVKRGGTLSSGFAKFPNIFPALLIAMVKAGEESGKLAESLRVVSTQMERASNLTKKIRGAMIYPSIVLTAMVGIGILMLIYVVPTLTQTFTELHTELPPTTQFIISASNFLVAHTVFTIAAMMACILAIVYGLKTNEGKRVIDWVVLVIPVVRTIALETYSARTTRTLASLLSAGVDVVLSIGITRDVVGNFYYRKVLTDAESTVTKGGQLSEAFTKHPEIYPPLVAEMVAVGEETGRLSELLKDTAEFYEESVERQTKDLSTVVEPVLMIVIGAAVGFFALSMIAPIYSLSDSI